MQLYRLKTDEEKKAEGQTWAKTKILGVKKYAWMPTRLEDGRVVWLEHYYEYASGGVKDSGEYFLWSSSRDSLRPIIERHSAPVHRELPVKVSE